ncbi:hypothetical protein DL769_001839 [Monosporascus sp. CRB-8-3]|nr:hypothetical protein DL769_001839 [Monosporascus sp. CRB-8-3]
MAKTTDGPLRKSDSGLRQRRPSTTAERIVETAKLAEQRVEKALLILWDDLPVWRRDNHFIRSGYREESNSYWKSFTSLFYVHNEFVNIWTHATGAIIFPLLGLWLYHVITPRIVFLIVGSYVPALYYGLFCMPKSLTVYMYGIFILGFGCGVVSWVDRLRTPAWRVYRTSMFVGLGLSGVVPICHALAIYGYETLEKRIGLNWVLLQGFLYIFGAFLYAGKRFRPSDFNIRLSLSDEEQAAVSEGKHESHDEGFVDDGEPELDAEDEIEDDDLVESSGVEAPEKKIKKPKTKSIKHPEPPDQGSISSLGVVQEYPTDPSTKWTRSYSGPVKRWTRLQLLTKFWFGDRDNYLDIVGDFVRLWWDHQILPPKLVSKHDLRVASHPWMPNGFQEDQEIKFRRLYERYLAKRTDRPTTPPINRDKAFRRFLPQTDDDLTVILGHVADQKEHCFKRGQNMSFSGLGNPIGETDDGRTKSSGWLLDVAGIILSMAWAPSNSQTHQLLAMAVVPFSDQAFYHDPKKAKQESEKKEGSVQIWQFEADEDNKETSYNPNLSVCVQQNLLTWSEILRGYISIWPSAFAGNSTIVFGQLRVYAQGRYVMTLDSPPTCLSMGACHPCLLAGTADGSLWAVNIMKKAYSHREISSKMKLFRHEYRAAKPEAGQNGDEVPPPRGKCRILHGFLPERNSHPKAMRTAQMKKSGGTKQSKKKKGKAKEAKAAEGSEEENDDDDLSDALGELNAEPDGAVAQPLAVHDPQTRITCVTWNPNVRFSWWAAAAMGSGLVRIMDLGIGRETDGESNSSSEDSSGEGDQVTDASDGIKGDRDAGAGDDEMDEEDDDVVVTRRRPAKWRTVN